MKGKKQNLKFGYSLFLRVLYWEYADLHAPYLLQYKGMGLFQDFQ